MGRSLPSAGKPRSMCGPGPLAGPRPNCHSRSSFLRWSSSRPTGSCWRSATSARPPSTSGTCKRGASCVPFLAKPSFSSPSLTRRSCWRSRLTARRWPCPHPGRRRFSSGTRRRTKLFAAWTPLRLSLAAWRSRRRPLAGGSGLVSRVKHGALGVAEEGLGPRHGRRVGRPVRRPGGEGSGRRVYRGWSGDVHRQHRRRPRVWDPVTAKSKPWSAGRECFWVWPCRPTRSGSPRSVLITRSGCGTCPRARKSIVCRAR